MSRELSKLNYDFINDYFLDEDHIDVSKEVNLVLSIANSLRGAYEAERYKDVIIPMVIIRRFECALEETKDKVVELYKKDPKKPAIFYERESGYPFYNTSEFNLKNLLNDSDNIASNFENYVNGFSGNVKEILSNLDIYNQIKKLDKSNRLYTIIKKFSEVDLDPRTIDNHKMGYLFEDIIRRYSENVEAGDHYTPREVIRLLVDVLLAEGCDDLLTGDGKVCTVLDAACGSGAFLVKAMSIMIEQSGGMHTGKALKIKTDQLFGVEFDREIFALAAANFLIHKDGKTNLEHNDTQTKHVKEWIKDKKITKVLMNPPFEEKYGCMRIVKNVLDSVPTNTTCAFILPDKKLEKHNGKKLLKNHRLEKIIKLPETTFFGIGMTTSIFIFTSGISQKSQKIFSCYIEEDGLVTVKNQGRQDVYNRWPEIENKWIEIIHKQSGSDTIQWIDPNENLSWQEPEPPFVLYEEDFIKTIMDYEMFKKGIDPDVLKNKINTTVMYNSEVNLTDQGLDIQILGVAEDIEEYGDEN